MALRALMALMALRAFAQTSSPSLQISPSTPPWKLFL